MKTKPTEEGPTGLLQRSVRPTVDNQNESEAACSSPDTNCLPESAYKDGRLTFSGLMMTPEECQKSFENWFADRTPQMRAWGKELPTRWKQLGYLGLGDWPPENIGLEVLDYSLGVMIGVILSRLNRNSANGWFGLALGGLAWRVSLGWSLGLFGYEWQAIPWRPQLRFRMACTG